MKATDKKTDGDLGLSLLLVVLIIGTVVGYRPLKIALLIAAIAGATWWLTYSGI